MEDMSCTFCEDQQEMQDAGPSIFQVSADQLAMEEGSMVASNETRNDYLQEDAASVQAPLSWVQQVGESLAPSHVNIDSLCMAGQESQYV